MYRLLNLTTCLLIAAIANGQALQLTPSESKPSAPIPSDSVLSASNEETADPAKLPVQELVGEPIQRGPIHEAFAEPLQLTPQANKVLKQAPPQVIEELPPEAKSGENNMQWIAGYWAWDEQRQDYVWISGVWRMPPTGRAWVPGRWETVDGGHQWVRGAWMKSDTNGELVEQETSELPPKSLEQGPTSPAPSDNHFWIPGVWKQNEKGEYAWRPGFWSQSYENWVWVPDHYSWSPNGCTYVAGYWDYPWERRGTLYAPCTFGDSDLSGRVCYRPTQVIDTNQWLMNLWVGPRSGHYYYGDYYDCADLGYSPWYRYYGANRSYYDPFYSYYRWRFPRTYGIGLYGYLDGLYLHYNSHAAHRPRISVHGHSDRNRRTRGHTSLYGNVSDLHARHGRSNHRPYARDHFGDHGHRNRDPYKTYRQSGINVKDILTPQQRQRRLIGYGNGQPLYSDQVGRGVTRAQIGAGGSVGISRGQIGMGRGRTAQDSRGRNSGTDVDRMRRSSERQRRQANSTPRTNTQRPSSSRPLSTSRRVRSTTPPMTRSPRDRGAAPRANRSAPQVTRSAPRVNRSAPRVNRSAPQVNRSTPRMTRPTPRPAPRISRPAASPARSSSRGFSTYGLKTSRGANLTRQRAAMQKTISQRKGK